MSRSSSVAYFRNFIFGVEDGLVSTVALLSGVAVADISRRAILISGLVLILVEAFSMATGSFLSEYSADGYMHRTERASRRDVISGVIMFFSYFIAGFIPLSPYLFLPVDEGLKVSVLFGICALFLLGVVGAVIARTSVLKNATRMTVMGGIAIGLGMAAGKLLSQIV